MKLPEENVVAIPHLGFGHFSLYFEGLLENGAVDFGYNNVDR